MTENSGMFDRFRLIASILVISIHTSPLETLNPNADIFITRIIARTAVPFFFMVTGFYTNFEHPKKALLKLIKMYLAVTLLYLPFSFYSGYFSDFSLGNALKMLFFDGYYYHLWYFPACITGILIVHFLEKISAKNAFIVAIILYAVGIFGDSYYGISEKIFPLKIFYNILFNVFSYTRNGLFFAPIFLLLGSKLKKANVKFDSKKVIVACEISFVLMTAEAFLLKGFNIPRHDSMYVFLIPTMLFLFALLNSIRIPQKPILRKISMWIYIIHPLIIIILRGISKIFSENFFEKRELLLFILTAVFSGLFSILAVIITRKARNLHNALHCPNARTWAEIDVEALRNNVEFLRKISPKNSELMPAVKANAYGHGAVLISRELNKMGVRAFCVASADEGAKLRKHGIRGEILILGYTHPAQFPLLRFFRLSQTIVSYEYAKILNSYGKIHCHIGIDTGMRRLGIRSEEQGKIQRIFEMKNLIIDGIFTHLSADETTLPADLSFTEQQSERFYNIAESLAKSGYYPKVHLLASYGLLNYAHLGGDYVRAGIALYGGVKNTKLLPVLSLKTRVTSVRKVYKGEPIGYGLECVANEDMHIASLAIGYADGLPRALSDGQCSVLINGKRAPIIGKICMDQTIADVTQIKVKQGDIAVIIGNSGDETITANEIAERADTIPNDILSRIGSRVVICKKINYL